MSLASAPRHFRLGGGLSGFPLWDGDGQGEGVGRSLLEPCGII